MSTKIPAPQDLTDVSNYFGTMSDIAGRSGIFFFSLIFIFVVTVLANRWNRQVSLQNPPASNADLIIYRTYFVACSIVSFSLVGLCAWFWIQDQNRHHLLEIEIVGLAEGEFLGAENLFRDEKPRIERDTQKRVKDYKFVMSKTKPFRKGEVVSIKYWKAKEGEGQLNEEGPQSIQIPIRILEEKSWLSYRYRLEKKGEIVSFVQIQN